LTRSAQPASQSPASDPAGPERPLQASNSQNWKLTLSYDGTDFSGWQVQPGEQTIQGELQAALGRVTGESPLPQGAGRTDAGVHALGQAASFKLEARIPAENLHRALNRTLPQAIRILDAKTVADDFHARHSALAKTYEYRVYRQPVCPPFQARYVYACPWPMELKLLQQAARWFEGEHDFLSFAATDPDLRSRERSSGTRFDREQEARKAELARSIGKQGAVRTIYSSTWESRGGQAGDLLVYRVRGNGFLHHMVRNLVGTMLDVGRGYRKVEAIPAMLAARSRAAAGPTAPAQGLFLDSVEYPAQN
jgi:tRNA pseudouridine38-40 synthase